LENIGIVTKLANGAYEGRLVTLSIKAPIRIVPITASKPNAPTFRIMSEGAEVGAGWIRQNRETGDDYVSLTDTPELTRKIYANLGIAAGQDDQDVFAIIWNRPVH